MNTNLSSKALDSGTLSSTKSFSFSESEFLISGKYANLSFMHITISFSVLPENKIKRG